MCVWNIGIDLVGKSGENHNSGHSRGLDFSVMASVSILTITLSLLLRIG